MDIRVTPDEFKRKSDQALSDINAIEHEWREISSRVIEARNYWEGRAGDAHYNIYKDIAGDMEAIIRRLGENQSKLRAMAGIYDVAEAKAEDHTHKLPDEVF